MTYCLGIALSKGIVFCSDSRTNAGPDRVNTYSKMHSFFFEEDRSITLLSAGNLATSQSVIAKLNRDLEGGESITMRSGRYVSDVADYVGELLVAARTRYASEEGPDAGLDASASFIIGGQIAGQEPELYMVYPEGNHIAASSSQPYLQIGETKYGKPILDRILQADTEPETAMRCAIVSVDSTMRSNATVGPPIECLFYRRDSLLKWDKYVQLDDDHPYLTQIRKSWDENIKKAFDQLPALGQSFEVPG